MKRTVLIAGGEAAALAALRRSLGEAGFRVEVSPDGFYAALLLERERPAAVLVPSSLPDMEPRELGQILRSDPDLSAIQRILIPLSAGELPDPETAELFHLVLPAGAAAERQAALVEAALAPGRPAAEPAPSLSGTLEAVDFPQLIQLLAETRLSGVLRIRFKGSEAQIYFNRGEVIHCAWGEFEGRRAFVEILRAAVAPGVPFRYEKMSLTDAFRLPKTITGPVQKLLLAAAVDLDEDLERGHWASGGGAPGG
jgi:CheY-like chemotaxis protein